MQQMVGANFNPLSFDHVAKFSHENSRIEISLRSNRQQTVTLTDLDLTISIQEGDEIRTEISEKYDRKRAENLLTNAGFELVEWFTDTENLLGLALGKKPE